MLPEPHGSLGLGFLLGVRTLLPEDLEEQLSRTGLTHIVAVSGYNITIMINSFRKLVGRYSRKLSVIGGFMLLGIFFVMAGGSPSIQRASIVASITLVSWYFGRATTGMSILILSAAISAWLNPLFIWHDVGWHLSFLAFFGVLVLAPLLMKHKKRALLSQIFIETSSAQLLTTPIILFVFSKFSVLSIVANMIVLPVIPLAMLVTFISGVLGLISFTVGAVFSKLTKFVLSYIVEVVQFMAGISWASIEIGITNMQFLVCMVMICVLTFMLWRHQASIKAAQDTV